MVKHSHMLPPSLKQKGSQGNETRKCKPINVKMYQEIRKRAEILVTPVKGSPKHHTDSGFICQDTNVYLTVHLEWSP